MKYFDAHCHVQFPAYDEDRGAVLASMKAEDVGALVVGVDYASSEKAIQLVEDSDHLWASVGLHPNDTEKEVFDKERFRALIEHPKVKAIGECGLDNFRPENPEAATQKQKEVFEQHIQLAIEADKPLMIHSRPAKGSQDAYRDSIEILTSYKKEFGEKLRGDMHFFVGGIEEARDFVELDFTLSYTAVLTFAREYDEVVRFVPLTHLLSETDSPYVAPPPNRGRRNDPLAVLHVVDAIAQIRTENKEVVREQLLRTAQQLFSL